MEVQVDDAGFRGATVHLGGAVPKGPGAFYAATVLSGVDPTMRAYGEELFGPVAVLYRVSSPAQAVAIANDSPYGLGAAVFSSDETRARDVADQLDVGMVGINTTIKSAPDMPFGGVKSSGVGRELGRFGLDDAPGRRRALPPRAGEHPRGGCSQRHWAATEDGRRWKHELPPSRSGSAT